MSAEVEVELYRTDDYIRDHRIDLLPLLHSVLEPLVGMPLSDSGIHLTFLGPADERSLGGRPALVNLRASHGYVMVRIIHAGEIVYRHPHAVRELIARPLQQLLADQFPQESHWGFGVQGPGLDSMGLVRPAPRPRNEIEIAGGTGRPAAFHLEEIPDPQPPAADLAGLGVVGTRRGGGGTDLPLGVVVRPTAFDALANSAPFSDEVEEGGFLFGHVYRDADRPDRHLVEVVAAVAAQRTGASLLHFTFTGESFLRVGELLTRRGRGEQLVGWYHTHLFPATGTLGLSSIDVELHKGTFQRPWQVAGLVNLSHDSRVLRFYGATKDGMAQASYWVADHDS